MVRAGDVPDTGTTSLSPWDVAGGDRRAEAVMGLVLPGLRTHWNDDPEPGDDFRSRLWIWDDALTSWATVDYDGRRLDTFHVRQHGPRRLWDEVAAAWSRWTGAGRPAFDAFGLDVGVGVDVDGTQTVWCGDPDGPTWPIPPG